MLRCGPSVVPVVMSPLYPLSLTLSLTLPSSRYSLSFSAFVFPVMHGMREQLCLALSS